MFGVLIAKGKILWTHHSVQKNEVSKLIFAHNRKTFLKMSNYFVK